MDTDKSKIFSEDSIKRYLDAEIYFQRGMTREQYIEHCREKWDNFKYDPLTERKIIVDFLMPIPFEPPFGQAKESYDYFEAVPFTDKNGKKKNDVECFAMRDVIFKYQYDKQIEIAEADEVKGDATQPEFYDFEDSIDTKLYLVALFDVLGFSEIISKIGSSGIIEKYQELINLSILNKDYKSFTRIMVGKNKYLLGSIYVPIKYAYFSDTIILWTRIQPFNYAPISTFIQKCSDLMCEALKIDIPLRGSISYGEGIMHKEKNIFIGQSIVEAAKLEKAQKWVGLSFSYSFRVYEMREAMNSHLVTPGFCKHLKHNLQEAHPYLTLNWTSNWKEKGNPDLVEVLNKMKDLAPVKNKEYYTNTIDFISYSEKQSDKETDFFLRSMHLRFPNTEVLKPEIFNMQRLIIKIKENDFVAGKFFSFPDSILSESQELKTLYNETCISIILDENDEIAKKFFADSFSNKENSGVDIEEMHKYITFIKRTHIDYIDFYIYDEERYGKIDEEVEA